MNFRQSSRDEPEINLIPFIDVLLVVLIFLMLSTTYSKFAELQLTLPVADADAPRDRAKEVLVGVTADGAYTVNKVPVAGRSVESLARALTDGANAGRETVLLISADASARHQAVITVMEAARRAGLIQIPFATQTASANGTPCAHGRSSPSVALAADTHPELGPPRPLGLRALASQPDLPGAFCGPTPALPAGMAGSTAF